MSFAARAAIDNTELKVYGVGEWLQERHGGERGALGANCLRQWMPIAAIIVASTLH